MQSRAAAGRHLPSDAAGTPDTLFARVPVSSQAAAETGGTAIAHTMTVLKMSQVKSRPEGTTRLFTEFMIGSWFEAPTLF